MEFLKWILNFLQRLYNFQSQKSYCLNLGKSFKFYYLNKKVINIIVLAILLNQELIQSLIIVPVGIISCLIIIITIIIFLQPENTEITTYKLPFSPFLQMIAVFVNVFLITTLSVDTFFRFAVWFGIGLFVYFGYGVRKSGEHHEHEGQIACMPCIEWKSRKQEKYIIKKDASSISTSEHSIIVAF